MDTHRLDTINLLHQDVARQAVGRNAEMQHTAGQWPGFMDLHLVTQSDQVVSSRKAARAGANDQHTLAAAARLDRNNPAFRSGFIAKKTFDRVDTDGAVQIGAIAGGFAGVVTHPPMHGRHRVVAHQVLPSLLELAGLRQR